MCVCMYVHMYVYQRNNVGIYMCIQVNNIH